MIRTYHQMHLTDKYSQFGSVIWSVWPNDWVFLYEISCFGFESCCIHLNFIQTFIECGFTVKLVGDMIRTLSQLYRTDKYSQTSYIIWSFWSYFWVIVFVLSGSGFKSTCSHLNFRFRACLDQGVPSASCKNRVWLHSETHTLHDKNIPSNALYR